MGNIEQMIFISYFRDISVNGRNTLIRIFKQYLRQAFNGIKVIIYIYIIQFIRLISETHRIINHQFPFFLIVSHFRCPCATNLTQACRQLVKTDIRTFPVNQIPRLHQHQSIIVSPTIHITVTFPFSFPVTVPLCKHVQVCHCQIEGAIRSTINMRVTNTSLIGNRIAGNYRFPVIHGCKSISVTADSHIQAMRFVLVEYHQISTHVRFLRNGILITELIKSSTSLSSRQQSYTQSIETMIIIVVHL